MKILRIGDMHVQVSNIDDCEKLLIFILATAEKEKVDAVEFLGDMFHTHSIIRAEVLDFWHRWLKRLSGFYVRVLVGNHDMKNQKEPNSLNALSHFMDMNGNDPWLHIIDKPMLHNNILYLPYIHDNTKFIEIANSYSNKANVLVCHFTPDGSKCENGFYAPEGVNVDLLNFQQIISGHIHMEGTYDKCWLPGTPKWDTASDANQSKGIWLCKHDDNTGLMTEKIFISTWGVVTPIISLVWNEGSEQPILPECAISSIEIIGSAAFVNKGKEIFKGKAKIKTKITDKIIRENRKSSKSVLDFLDNVYKTSFNKEKLKKYLLEKNYV